MPLIASARMYSVTPEAEAAWVALLDHVSAEAGVPLEYFPYPAPLPLDELWSRPDLGCVLMCGFPIAFQLAEVFPIAAPIPAFEWAAGKPVYRTDLIVRADSPYATLADAFGGTLGWTVEHSHSGFNALRHHLLRRRPAGTAKAFARTVGSLTGARGILDEVKDGTIDIGPLDSYWHELLKAYRPELFDNIRVLDSTATAPIPSFVASEALDPAARNRLALAFEAAGRAPWFPPFGRALLIEGFKAMRLADFEPTLDWEREAKAAGYPYPG